MLQVIIFLAAFQRNCNSIRLDRQIHFCTLAHLLMYRSEAALLMKLFANA